MDMAAPPQLVHWILNRILAFSWVSGDIVCWAYQTLVSTAGGIGEDTDERHKGRLNAAIIVMEGFFLNLSVSKAA